MTDNPTPAKPLDDVFAHLLEDGGILSIPVTEDFWSNGVASLPKGRLVSLMKSQSDWSSWEMHPNGDEFILLLSGALKLFFEFEEREWNVIVRSGEFVVVPKGAWHTADVIESARALFITQGDGTEHKERSSQRA